MAFKVVLHAAFEIVSPQISVQHAYHAGTFVVADSVKDIADFIRVVNVHLYRVGTDKRI